MLRQYELVRVVKLMQLEADYDGWRVNQRPPRIGDVGTILDVLSAPGLPDEYVVEAVNGDDATTIWLAIFLADELETFTSP